MRVLNRRQMQDADRRTIDEIGIPSIVLMENAGREVVAAIAAAFEHVEAMTVAVIAGRGSNGGDGFVAARLLAERGVDVSVYLVGRGADVAGDARSNLDALRTLGQDVVEIGDAAAWEIHAMGVVGADVIIDALVGTGLRAPLSGLMETIVQDINAAAKPVVAVDLPSGLSADRVDVDGPAIHAAMTVTLGAPKLPLVLPPAEAIAGRLIVADIGIPRGVIDSVAGPWLELLTPVAMRALVPTRAAASHKGDYGRILVIGGSRGKAGAPALTASAALRSGAGLVTVGTPTSCWTVAAGFRPEAMTEPLEETTDGLVALAALDRVLAFDADVIALGPGLGRSSSTTDFVHALVERAKVPLVIDADALNAFANDIDRLSGRDGRDVIVTPHPGEMARLTGFSIEDVQANRLDVARDFATTRHVYVVLKGHRTIIATPAGKTFINPTGNPGMATAGSGDVLTGVVSAWLAQLRRAEDATTLAVYLHGAAGDLAAADEGEVAMIAGDIIDRLGDAVLELTGRRAAAPSR